MNDFEELRRLKQQCENQSEHIEQLKSTLDGLSGIRYDKEAVQCSMDGDPMLAKICRIEDEEQKLTDLIVKYCRCRIEIAQKINQMELSKRQHLLRIHYLDEWCIETCANSLKWSVEYTRKELRKAVQEYLQLSA